VVISIVYNCTEPLDDEKKKRSNQNKDYNPKYDVTPVPIFILRKCKGNRSSCRIFIDHEGRVYTTWNKYLTENKLPECKMILPVLGQYMADKEGRVLLERHESPVCDVGSKVLKGFDIGSAIVGLGSGGVFIAASIPAVVVAPVALIAAGIAAAGVGAYSIGRSSSTIHDRRIHKQSLSFANSESRNAYLSIVASSLGFVGAGANIAVSQLAARSFNIARGAKMAVDTINVANLGASGFNVVNAGFDVLDQWVNENRLPSPLDVLQLGSSILFLGHAVVSFKTTGTIISNLEESVLGKIQKSLRNSHKHIFNRFPNEPYDQNDSPNRKIVVKTLRNISVEEKNGVFTINDQVVRLDEMKSIEKEKFTYLTPKSADNSQNHITDIVSVVEDSFKGTDLVEIKKFSLGLLYVFGSTSRAIRNKIIKATAALSAKIMENPINEKFCEMFPEVHTKYYNLFIVVMTHFQQLIDSVEKEYSTRQKNKNTDSADKNSYFTRLNPDRSKRAIEIFNKVTKTYFTGINLTSVGLQNLLECFCNWVLDIHNSYQSEKTEKQKRKQDTRKQDTKNQRQKQKCNKCGGYYYNKKTK
jgi:hypothetical protein